MALNGSLDDYSPAGALRVLSSTGKTGAVRFSGEAGCTVYLHRGQLYFARDEATDNALATALVRPGRLTAEDWSRAIEEAGEMPRVGELLVSSGAIDADLLASVVLSVVYDPLIRLFREGDGAFEFEPDTVHWIGPFRAFNVDAIANEVRRRVREVDEMAPVVPSIDSWVTANHTLPGNAVQVTLLREDWELVTSLTGPRTIAELAGDMGRGRYSTARVVHRLAQAGLVEVVPEMMGPMDVPDAVAFTTLPTPVTPVPVGGPDDTATPTDTDPGPTSWSGNGFEPHPGITEAETAEAEAWSLPKRSVAVDDDPTHGLAARDLPWPESEDLDMDDPAAQDRVPGLAGIAGFRNAVPTPEATEDGELSPNAAWLEGLYEQYMEEPEAPGKKRKKEMLDVAFQAEEVDDTAKVGTLRRLMDALKKL